MTISTNSTIIHRLQDHPYPLVPKISHCHQRHLHTSISYSSSLVAELLVVVDFPWNTRVLLGPFRVKLPGMVEAQQKELATAVQSVQAQLMASEAARSNLQAQVERLGRTIGERKIGDGHTEPRVGLLSSMAQTAPGEIGQ